MKTRQAMLACSHDIALFYDILTKSASNLLVLRSIRPFADQADR